jgi:hypothetical protein
MSQQTAKDNARIAAENAAKAAKAAAQQKPPGSKPEPVK